jgi:hypothetical protein
MRRLIGSGKPRAASDLDIARWISTAATRPPSADRNSTSAPSPMSLTILPFWAATIGRTVERKIAFSAARRPRASRSIIRL